MANRVPLASLMAIALLASCNGVKQPTAVRPTGTAAPRVEAVSLAGTVKLLATPAISDNGAGAISDNGAGIISNNGGTIVSDHGVGIISQNGAGLTGKSKRTALAAPAAHEYLLADAVITLTDAAGKPVTDGAGKPIQAVTDAKGAYHLAASLPAKNLVMHVRLHDGGALHGGELAALLARDNGASRPIDTASSLGASYVLQQFVHGDQATLDKLPGAASLKLDAAIAGALAATSTAPGYQSAELLKLADDLRGKAPAVASAFADIKALLLGQAALGAGRQATEVALSQPLGLVAQPDGSLLVCEAAIGRIRSVQADGTIQTFADATRGTIRRTFIDTLDLTRGADGTLYLASYGLVLRIGPDGKVSTVAGNAKRSQGPVDVQATDTSLMPNHVAVTSDGTLYIGEELGKSNVTKGRLLAVGKDGIVRQIPLPTATGLFEGLVAGPDDTLYALFQPGDGGVLYRIPPGKPATVLASGLPQCSDLKIGPDGTLYLADRAGGVLWLIGADGARRAIAGFGSTGDRAGIRPYSLAITADGTVFVSDIDNGLVHKLTPDGGTRLLAGATLASQSGTDLRNVALNQPVGAAFDGKGALLMTEGGNRSIVRFDGHSLTRLTPGGHGDSGDGGPLSAAKFGNPSGLAIRGDEIFVVDGEAGRLRKIAANGTISTVVGPGLQRPAGLERGERVAAAQYGLNDGGLAVDAAGRPYFSRNNAFQVFRLAADGKVEAPIGLPPSIWTSAMVNIPANILGEGPKEGSPAADARLFLPTGLAFDSKGALYVADLQGFRILKVTGLDGPNPVVTTFAGVGAGTALSNVDAVGPGKEEGIQAKSASLILPLGLCIDAQDNLFVSEIGTQGLPATYQTGIGLDLAALPPISARVRRITPDGVITTVAGPGSKLFPDPTSEDGLGLPTGLAVAPDGRLAIVDPGTNLVHLVPAGGY
ncbi:MAG: SMP-30/Gluconolaconase/LRE domain protein [Cyanobacteria bacterium RYN_339]|nr:SMP-30/Gluconolaconase/LRE domain protein [Cyanobacteria bacterium RYN_339]